MKLFSGLKIIAFVFILSLSLSAGLMAQDTKVSVGVVDLETVVNESKEGKAKVASLKTKFEKIQKDLKAQGAEIEKMEAELKKMAEKKDVDQNVFNKKLEELRAKVVNFQELSNKHSVDFQKDERSALDPIIKKAREQTKKIAEAKGCVLVVDINSAVYYSNSIDLTDEILKTLK